MDIWRQAHGGKKPKEAALETRAPEPDEDESKQEFMERCLEETDDDEEACELAWEENRSAPEPVLRHKTHSGTVNGLEFVLSDETPDRMNDIISAQGWDLENFKKNPVALWAHRSDVPPIGKWNNLRVDKGALRGHLELAPKGTSDRIDEIRKLVEAGILQAVSVGFRPLESQPRKSDDGKRRLGEIFLRQELIETSLVSVPANPNSLAVAKAMNISPATIDLVFGGQANRDDVKRRGFHGGHAKRNDSTSKEGAMSLPQRIQDLEGQIVSTTEKLDQHLGAIDDSNVADADMQVTKELNAKLEQLKMQHGILVQSEKLLGTTSDDGQKNKSNGRSNLPAPYVAPRHDGLRPITLTSKKPKELEVDVADYIMRSGVVALKAKIDGRPPDEIRQQIYGDDEGVRALVDMMVTRAASAPAMTTVSGWALELAQQTYTTLLPLLYPDSIYPQFAPKGLQLSFGRAAKIVIPMRSATPTIAGSFVGEGSPIPVRQGAFTSQTMVPKKMAVITTWTKEMNDHSTPAIEGVLREAIQQDTAVSLDSVLIDANPATATRPAGLLNGVSVTTATAGAGLAALIGDIKALTGALLTPTKGNIRTPVWLMNPADALSISLIPATAGGGEFPFRTEILGGSLNGFPVIKSGTVPAKTVILVDAADFVSATGDGPRWEISDQATLHEEDTTPLPLASAGTPNTVAAPQRSLFQTDSLALKLVMPLNWIMRRSGMVAWTQNVTW
jgi:HK97 family phage prohead protease